ncbi:MAG: hypothetical protein ACI9DF_000520 [Verrucomicrobiales bacterium]|jgi:hypothetical protein
MDNGLPAVPGFRSLSQAGIQLKEGERLEPAALSKAIVSQLRSSQNDPEWPPLPTMPRKHGEGFPNSRHGDQVAVLPRAPGTKRPIRQAHEPAPSEGVPSGHYVGQLPTIQFACPSCGVVLTISNPKAYNGQPGPCPHCSAVVLPPRVVSPFARANEAAQPASPGDVRHYSGHSH